jgi:hypothetical protein
MRDIGTTARTPSGKDGARHSPLRAWLWIPACAGMAVEERRIGVELG